MRSLTACGLPPRMKGRGLHTGLEVKESTIRVSITAAPNSTEEIWQFSFAEISHR